MRYSANHLPRKNWILKIIRIDNYTLVPIGYAVSVLPESLSAMRTRSANDLAFIFRMT